MSDMRGDWAALSSEHERLMPTTDHESQPVHASPARELPPRWAELASQRERLLELAEPTSGPAGSRHDIADSRHSTTGLRLVVSSAA